MHIILILAVLTGLANMGSAAVEEYVDWGLKPGTRYYYRVTAVDRRRNESAPSDAVAVTTEALSARSQAQVEATWDTREGRPVGLEFEMPADGDFVVWG